MECISEPPKRKQVPKAERPVEVNFSANHKETERLRRLGCDLTLLALEASRTGSHMGTRCTKAWYMALQSLPNLFMLISQ